MQIHILIHNIEYSNCHLIANVCFLEPQFNKDQPVFTYINSSHARLNLQGWASGGCPISVVTLEFRPKGHFFC